VNEYKLLELSDIFVTLEDEPAKLERALHERAKSLIANNDIEGAWMTLLAFND
jgi:hypothetical protein